MTPWRLSRLVLRLALFLGVAGVSAVSNPLTPTPTPAPAAAKAIATPSLLQPARNVALPGQMSGEITSGIPGRSIRDVFATAKNIVLDVLDANGNKVGAITAEDNLDGKTGRYRMDRDNPRHFSVRAPASWLGDQLQWQYYQQWTTGDDRHNVTNVVLKSVSGPPKWRGVKGDITGSVAGYSAAQWFGGSDKIWLKVWDASNKLVETGMSHPGYGGAPASYDIKVDNPAGARVEAPHLHNQVAFTWDYEVKSDVGGVRTIDVKLKKVDPLVVITSPAPGSLIWINKPVKISWSGPPADTPVIVGYSWPAKNIGDFATVWTLEPNPGTYTWDIAARHIGYPQPFPIARVKDSTYSSGFIRLRGGGYGNNQFWTWDAKVPVFFMTPYVRITNIASESEFHAGAKLTVNFEKAGLTTPQVKLSLKHTSGSPIVWHTSENSLTVTLPTQAYPGWPQFSLTVEAEGESNPYVAGTDSVLIWIRQ
ncbi:MAG: hypothetical protein IPL89_00075 [Acidobacteria bacterium]|nr:hypothetical protein [Acidobacteriota bacterium]